MGGKVRALSTIHVTPPTYGAGVARPRVYEEERVSTAVRLPASLHEQLKEEARARQVSVNFLVERAVGHYLELLPERAAGERP